MSYSFKQLGLIDELLDAVKDLRFTEPTTIQAHSIPLALKNKDIQGSAQTGTGKTAAFALPILQKLHFKEAKDDNPKALILAPTRELAMQICEDVKDLSKYLDLKTTAVYGKASINSQIEALEAGVDILVATPGRLLDHLSQETVDLNSIRFLVLDEADRMLDMGFKHDIRKIQLYLPKHRQNMLFSATFPRSVQELAERVLVHPVKILADRSNSPADTVTQVVHPVAAARKVDLLIHLIEKDDLNQVLVFTKTRETADFVTGKLKTAGISAVSLHGDKSRGARKRALEDFEKIKVRVLVATDIASRGIDIDTLMYVVNYELPGVPEDYIHRIGRTGRAGNKGTAITFICADERRTLKQIEHFLKREIPEKEIGDFRREDNPTMKSKGKSGPIKSSKPQPQSSNAAAPKRRPKKKNQKKFKRR